MRERFMEYLKMIPNFKSVDFYFKSIDLYLPRKLQEKNIEFDAFKCSIEELREIQERLDKGNDLEIIGNYGSRTIFYALRKFIIFRENFGNEVSDIKLLVKEEYTSIDNFEYEKDLENSIYRNLITLFPNYIKYKNCKQFLIATRKIDLLLECKDKSHLLVIELKAGSIDRKAFGQISEYLVIVEEEFKRKVKGCLIGNDFEEHILKVIKSSKYEIDLMKYNIEVKLEKI